MFLSKPLLLLSLQVMYRLSLSFSQQHSVASSFFFLKHYLPPVPLPLWLLWYLNFRVFYLGFLFILVFYSCNQYLSVDTLLGSALVLFLL